MIGEKPDGRADDDEGDFAEAVIDVVVCGVAALVCLVMVGVAFVVFSRLLHLPSVVDDPVSQAFIGILWTVSGLYFGAAALVSLAAGLLLLVGLFRDRLSALAERF